MTLDTDLDDIKDIKSLLINCTNLVRSGASDMALAQVDAALSRLEAHAQKFPHRADVVEILLNAGLKAREALVGLAESQHSNGAVQ